MKPTNAELKLLPRIAAIAAMRAHVLATMTAEFPDSDYLPDSIAEFDDATVVNHFACKCHLAPVETVEEVKDAVDLVEYFFAPSEVSPLMYEGYMGVICSSADSYVWQCLTHFLGEGLEPADERAEKLRLGELFHDAGYMSDEDYERFLADAAAAAEVATT